MIELLKQIRRFDPNLSREQNQRYYELETKIETLESKHEALKKDVARYFETRNRLKTILPTANDITEFWALEEKLAKIVVK